MPQPEELLSDAEVYDHLHKALLVLAYKKGATPHGDNALETARRALIMMQLTLTHIAERDDPEHDAASLGRPPRRVGRQPP